MRMNEVQQLRGRAIGTQKKRRDWAKIFFSFSLGVGAFTLTMLSLGVAILAHPGFDVLIIILFVFACVLWITALSPWIRPRLERRG